MEGPKTLKTPPGGGSSKTIGRREQKETSRMENGGGTVGVG